MSEKTELEGLPDKALENKYPELAAISYDKYDEMVEHYLEQLNY